MIKISLIIYIIKQMTHLKNVMINVNFVLWKKNSVQILCKIAKFVKMDI